MPAYLLQKVENEVVTEEKRKQLKQEIEQYDGPGKRCVNKVRKFMEAHEIWKLDDLNFEWRQEFAKEITADIRERAWGAYLKAFDHLKQYSLRKKECFLIEKNISKYPYENKFLFLPYHPVQDLVKRLERIPMREEWLWDFSLPAPILMKQQMYICLNNILKKDGDLLHVRLTFLHLFYEFCVENKVADIELIRMEQIQAYRSFLKQRGKTKDFGILDMCRCILFVQGKDIRWDAMVWYLERFHLNPERIDPASPVVSLSFVEITHEGNRELLQKYVQYTLGLTDLSINTLQAEMLKIRAFLQELEVDIREITEDHINAYLDNLQENKIAPETFNMHVAAIQHFYDFLFIRQYIKEIPFCADYYLKKAFPVHHDRSVPENTAEEILDNIHRFPEHLRLMYLHLWAIGLRISEVCRLKGNAYYIEGEDAWIQVYQTKMKNYKRIPIPKVLYQLMQIYLKRNSIMPDAYIFQNRNGGAYKSGTFRKQMIRLCKELEIQNGEYLFKAHDYRHGVATYFYDNGVSLQGIRDYLGHTYEEMTQQYIDYMPRRIDNANKDYFEKQGDSLAVCLKEGVKK